MQTIDFRHRGDVRARRAWFRLKHLLGQNTNTDKNYLAGDAAVCFRSGTLPPGTRITCAGRVDGLGLQAMARISGLNFAKAFGATYVDTPFVKIGHAPGEMKAWVDAWENRFNFGKGEERIGDRAYEIVDYADYVIRSRPITENVVLRFQQCFWLHRHYPDTFATIAPALRDKFGVAQRLDRSRLVVAAHVRRGDVTQKRHAERFTPDAPILAKIELLRSILGELGVPAIFQVYSEGKPENFADFSKIGCELHLDTDAVWTMQQLVEADVLVMAKSAFSYVPALIGNGVKLYEPMFEPPLSSWIICRKDGTFDRERTRNTLARYLDGPRSPSAEPASVVTPPAGLGSLPT